MSGSAGAAGRPGRTDRPAEGGHDARGRILERIRDALGEQEAPALRQPHPGRLDPAAQAHPWAPDVVEALTRRLEASGAEVVRLADGAAAEAWLAEFASGFTGVAAAAGLPVPIRPALPEAPPEEAPLGVSLARVAAAQTGTLLLSSREGRRHQTLPPTHLVWVPRQGVVATLGEAMARMRGALPALLALHSGPSKSADIGQILVRGVHGPGRLVVAVLEEGVAGADQPLPVDAPAPSSSLPPDPEGGSTGFTR